MFLNKKVWITYFLKNKLSTLFYELKNFEKFFNNINSKVIKIKYSA